MKNYRIYNKSSEHMAEVKDSSVDLIIGSPPYNIGTKYAENNDLLKFEDYKNMIIRVYSECYRVLKQEGILIIELADSIFSEGTYIQLAGLLQSICLEKGFYLETRHINFVKSENHIEGLEHDWDKDYTTQRNAHSNCHQILVFRKKKVNWKEGKIIYVNYTSAEGHPCPTPQGVYTFLLDLYFKKGNLVLDPFAGIAGLGAETLKRGGEFIGYELSKEFSEYASAHLSKVKV